MKKIFTLAVVFAAAMTAAAQTSVMRIHTTSGEVISYSVDDIDHIDFAEESPVQPTLVDLGGEANCYIANQPTRYRFRTTHVDGTPIAGIDHATWLWREKSGGNLVDEVSYNAADGTIEFLCNGREGNAVISAVGADGQIVWNWHIWCTDTPADFPQSPKRPSTIIMDRHLGAVSAGEADGRDTWGLVYQYGRNVPFYFINDNQEYLPSEAFNQANAHTEINPEFPDMKWHTEAYKRTMGYSVEESMAMPLTHLLHDHVSGSQGGYHWEREEDLLTVTWGNRTIRTKTNYDPCPHGYKVPFAEQLDFSEIEYTPYDFSSGNLEDVKTQQLLYPIPGFHIGEQWWPTNTGRHYEDGCALYGLNALDHCDRLFLWTAYAGDYQANIFTKQPYAPLRVVIQNDYTNGQFQIYSPTAGTGAFGHAVRCVREESPIPAAAPAAKAGQRAADFALTLADGTTTTLSAQVNEADYTLLYFNNPECSACGETLRALKQSSKLQQHIADGSLRVVSVYTDEEPAMWRSHVSEYPATWTVAYDAPQRVLTEGLYDMSRTPALYLIDRAGRIVLADTNLHFVETTIK